jgi:hypothetical protein
VIASCPARAIGGFPLIIGCDQFNVHVSRTYISFAASNVFCDVFCPPNNTIDLPSGAFTAEKL